MVFEVRHPGLTTQDENKMHLLNYYQSENAFQELQIPSYQDKLFTWHPCADVPEKTGSHTAAATQKEEEDSGRFLSDEHNLRLRLARSSCGRPSRCLGISLCINLF